MLQVHTVRSSCGYFICGVLSTLFEGFFVDYRQRLFKNTLDSSSELQTICIYPK